MFASAERFASHPSTPQLITTPSQAAAPVQPSWQGPLPHTTTAPLQAESAEHCTLQSKSAGHCTVVLAQPPRPHCTRQAKPLGQARAASLQSFLSTQSMMQTPPTQPPSQVSEGHAGGVLGTLLAPQALHRWPAEQKPLAQSAFARQRASSVQTSQSPPQSMSLSSLPSKPSAHADCPPAPPWLPGEGSPAAPALGSPAVPAVLVPPPPMLEPPTDSSPAVDVSPPLPELPARPP